MTMIMTMTKRKTERIKSTHKLLKLPKVTARHRWEFDSAFNTNY